MSEYTFEATGTVWNITFYDDEDGLDDMYSECRLIISDFEKKYSRFLDGSLISSLKFKVGEFEVGEEFVEILRIYFHAYKVSNGKFTPLIGEVLENLGYDKNYSFEPKRELLRKLPDLNQAIEILDSTRIKINTPISFDFGGVGKGFLIDKVSKFLQTQNIGRFCVDGGGDMFYSNGLKSIAKKSSLRIGLEHPSAKNEVIGVLDLGLNFSVSSSSNNKRKWLEYGHIVDPEHINSSEKILSSWIVSNSASIADLVSTLTFLVDFDNLKDEFSFEYFVLKNNFSYEISKDFDAELFSFYKSKTA